MDFEKFQKRETKKRLTFEGLRHHHLISNPELVDADVLDIVESYDEFMNPPDAEVTL